MHCSYQVAIQSIYLHGVQCYTLCAYVKIADAFQLIDTCAPVMKKEKQGRTKETP